MICGFQTFYLKVTSVHAPLIWTKNKTKPKTAAGIKKGLTRNSGGCQLGLTHY